MEILKMLCPVKTAKRLKRGYKRKQVYLRLNGACNTYSTIPFHSKTIARFCCVAKLFYINNILYSNSNLLNKIFETFVLCEAESAIRSEIYFFLSHQKIPFKKIMGKENCSEVVAALVFFT